MRSLRQCEFANTERVEDFIHFLRSTDVKKALTFLGAILYRGTGIRTVEDVDAVAKTLFEKHSGYVGGNSRRTRLGSYTFTSTEHPRSQFIPLHNELSYTSDWPRHLFFVCLSEPRTGGETPIADSVEILRSLDPQIVKTFRNKRLTYIRNLHSGQGFGKSWQETFQTSLKSDAEAACIRTNVKFRWLDSDRLQILNEQSAVQSHPVTGEIVWFNQADQFHCSALPNAVETALLASCGGRRDLLPQHVVFGSGEEIPDEFISRIRETISGLTFSREWLAGDLLLLDNMLVCHGRMPFEGDRRVLVSMGSLR